MLKNMKIGKKLILTYILIAVIFSIGSIVSLKEMVDMNSTYREVIQNYGFAQGDIGLFNTEFNNSNEILRDILSSTDSKVQEAGLTQLTASNAKVDGYLANMKKAMVN